MPADLHQESLCLMGTLGNIWRNLWISQLGDSAGTSWAKGRDASKHPMVPRMALPPRIRHHPPQVNMAKVGRCLVRWKTVEKWGAVEWWLHLGAPVSVTSKGTNGKEKRGPRRGGSPCQTAHSASVRRECVITISNRWGYRFELITGF